ncbi:BTB/POZ domain-containing protein 3-like [Halyomorpha halys]|uniref:BTB/POZ domain-containing protein 3-like n=1 Tax=Halyomorpha halys TaxID=286706 RepID=UPI0034D293A3
MESEPVPPQILQSAEQSTEDSSMMSTLYFDWQSKFNSVRERNSAMVNNELMSDVIFEVGTPGRSQSIPAHRYVLATGSSVFYAMFYGELADNRVEVPDVEPSIFISMLKYLYCDEISLEPKTVLPTLYVSKKYILPHLSQECIKYLHSTLTYNNVCILLQESRMFEESKLTNHCWDIIDAQTELVLRSEGMKHLDEASFISVLERDSLTCKESSIFSAALLWAEEECRRRGLEPTPEDRRNVLERALQLIRFPTMSLQEYANGPAQCGILTKDETINIFLFLTSTAKPILDFPTKPRTGLKIQVCHRCCKHTPVTPATLGFNRLPCRVRYDSINFSVDKRIFLVGYRLFGSVHGPSEYSVRLELKRQGKVIIETTTRYSSDGTQNTFDVFFEYPVQIDPGVFYCAQATYDGGPLRYYGIDGKSQIVAETVTFKFNSILDHSDGIRGQIPDILYYPSNNDI